MSGQRRDSIKTLKKAAVAKVHQYLQTGDQEMCHQAFDMIKDYIFGSSDDEQMQLSAQEILFGIRKIGSIDRDLRVDVHDVPESFNDGQLRMLGVINAVFLQANFKIEVESAGAQEQLTQDPKVGRTKRLALTFAASIGFPGALDKISDIARQDAKIRRDQAVKRIETATGAIGHVNQSTLAEAGQDLLPERVLIALESWLERIYAKTKDRAAEIMSAEMLDVLNDMILQSRLAHGPRTKKTVVQESVFSTLHTQETLDDETRTDNVPTNG